jgi:PEP-CTERM motif
MRKSRCLFQWVVIAMGVMLGAPSAASAATIYYGMESGAGPSSRTTGSAAAQQSFSQLGGTEFLLNFESASGSAPTLGYGNGMMTFSGEGLNSALTGVQGTTYPWASSNPYGFDTTEGTGQFFQVGGAAVGEGTSSSVTMNFSQSISAFSAYFSSLESNYGRTYISFTDNDGYHEFLLPGGANGQSVLFYGIDFNGRVSSLTFTTYNSSWGRDIYGIDDIRIVVNPEPGSLVLLGSGLLGAGYAARRRQRARRSREAAQHSS